MPCDGATIGYQDYAYERQLGRMLCKACKLLIKHEIKLTGDLKTWWEYHLEADKEKKQERRKGRHRRK